MYVPNVCLCRAITAHVDPGAAVQADVQNTHDQQAEASSTPYAGTVSCPLLSHVVSEDSHSVMRRRPRPDLQQHHCDWQQLVHQRHPVQHLPGLRCTDRDLQPPSAAGKATAVPE